MKIDDLCEVFHSSQFPSLETKAHPEREAVLSARSALAAAVIDDEFLTDCASWELGLLEADTPRRGLVPFFTVPNLGIRFAFGYWPPGATPGPHEHNAWTITAVCRNELEVVTYDREESYRLQQLVPKNRFEAPAGRVGFIYEPCIHQPTNTTTDWSLSLHVSSPRDGETSADDEGPLPGASFLAKSASLQDDHPYNHVLITRRRQDYVRELARMLVLMEVREAPQLLGRCSSLASSATRRMIDRSVRKGDRMSHPRSQGLLSRVHKDLILSYRAEVDMVALYVETETGPLEELRISGVAREAIAFASNEHLFDVRALPGNLSEEERSIIAEALEEAGLFRRVWQ